MLRQWQSVRHVNGVAVYAEEEDGDGDGGALMVSAVVRSSPQECFDVSFDAAAALCRWKRATPGLALVPACCACLAIVVQLGQGSKGVCRECRVGKAEQSAAFMLEHLPAGGCWLLLATKYCTAVPPAHHPKPLQRCRHLP